MALLCDQVMDLAERATPANIRAIRREMNVLQKKIAACRAKVWTEVDRPR